MPDDEPKNCKEWGALLHPTCVPTGIWEVHLNAETRKVFTEEVDSSS